MTRSIFILLLSVILSQAETLDSHTEKPTYYDILHDNVSKKVLDWSNIADTTISQWLGNDESNLTCASTKIVKPKSKTVDAFFQNNKYFNETENTFIRLRTDTDFQSKKSNNFNLRLSAQLPFSKCKQQLKLFVEDVSLNSDKQLNSKTDKADTNLGIRYFGLIGSQIESRYSLGIRGINPYVSTRYRLPFQTKQWQIDTIQTFKYSIKDNFEEETNIYFDKELKNHTLFRFNIQRGTSSNTEGMDYGFTFQYYLSAKQNIGLRFSQSFIGNTKYKKPNFTLTPTKSYSGINNYVTSLSYRANIWRKWFYYEIRPAVNFHKEFDYAPNYSVRLFFDFYFGEYH